MGEKPFKQQQLDISNNIHNFTNKSYIDTVIHVGLNKLEIENVDITVYRLTDNIKYNAGDVKALIKKFDTVIKIIENNFNYMVF